MAAIRTLYLPSGGLLTIVKAPGGGDAYQVEERDETGGAPRVVKRGTRSQVDRYVQARILKAKRG